MKFFRNRVVAIIITVIVVFVSVLSNTKTRLGDDIDDLSQKFFYTTNYTTASGTSTKSIYTSLSTKLSAANGLWTIVVNYDESIATQLSDARKALIWSYDLRDVEAMYEADQALITAFAMAEVALIDVRLSDSEEDAVNDYVLAFEGATNMISYNDYNSCIIEFYESTYSTFPTNILADLVGLEPPSLYSSTQLEA